MSDTLLPENPPKNYSRQPLPQLPKARGFGKTARKDGWWIEPMLVFLGFTAFVIYSTWAAFQGAYYWHGPYLSPFYAPELWGNSPHAWFGKVPPMWPSWLPYSPALLILGAPVGFRFTCYYYRGAYYKAFWQDPTSCAVGEPRNAYLGERYFPLLIQNIHRYFLYLAITFLILLTWDVWLALWFPTASGGKQFGIGLGTIIMLVNVCLLWSYTLGCHSLRHIVGGCKDEVSKSGTKAAYDCVSCLNRRHGRFAWFSLFSVGFTDIYIRLCAMGIWHDWRII